MTASSHEKLANRLADILARAYQGEPLIPADMADRYQVSLKTIQRDLKRLDTVLEKNEAEKSWQLIFRPSILLNRSDIKALIQALGMAQACPKKVLELVQDLVSSDLTKCYHFAEAAFDTTKPLANHHTLLEKAIRESRVVSFNYKSCQRHVHPYLLFYYNGLWYLRATEDGQLKSFYTGKLLFPRLSAENFTRDESIVAQFKACNSPWISDQKIEVKLRIASEVATFFTRRTLFSTQTDVQPCADGSLNISLIATCYEEVLPVIQYWLPHVQVISPLELNDKIRANIEKYLAPCGQTTLS